MPSLKAIRKRIVSVKNTQKITKAMKMVAAAKLRRAQDRVQAIRPYAGRMQRVVHDLVERLDAEPLREGEEESEQDKRLRLDLLIYGHRGNGGHGGNGTAPSRIRVVAVTSDRGLSGAFNSNVNRRTERFLVERKDAQVEIDVLGKKGRDYLRRRKVKIVHELAGAEPRTAAERATELAHELVTAMTGGQVDEVFIVYNEFKTAATQSVKVERLLPLAPQRPAKAAGTGPEKEDDEPRLLVDFLYEPSQVDVLSHLVPLVIQTEIHRILLESIASQFGAQMSAMDNASRNAKEMIARLTLQFNRARQAAITKELMEIIGGAEALKG